MLLAFGFLLLLAFTSLLLLLPALWGYLSAHWLQTTMGNVTNFCANFILGHTRHARHGGCQLRKNVCSCTPARTRLKG